MGGGPGQDKAASHPLHSLRSFSGCHTTGEEPQSTGEIAPAETNGSDLKKRTQCAPAQMSVTPSSRKDYDAMPAAGMCKNKAERSQFHPQGKPARLSKSGKTRARSE
jgi:hypothetical protein